MLDGLIGITECFEKTKLTTKTENVVRIKGEGIALDESLLGFINAFQQRHNRILPITNDQENIQLPQNLKDQVISISNELNIGEGVRGEIEELLTKVYASSNERIHLSKSGESEFLIYTFKNGAYKNVLIDGDGDVEVLFIPSDRSKTSSKRFYKINGINISSVLSAFNEV